MAEPTQNLKFSPDRLKQLLGENMNTLNSTTIEIGKKLDKAKADGNNEEYSALLGDLRIIQDDIERLQDEYTSLQEQEAKPELERISALGQELRQPKPSYMPSYIPIGGSMVPNRNLPTVKEDTQRKREIISELGILPPASSAEMESEKLPASLLAQLGSLPTPEGKTQLLENTFGKGNVLPIDVGGKPEFVIKLPDGSTKTTLEQGLAGLAGAAAVEVPLTIAEGAAGLTALGATKSPYLAAGAAAGTRATLGTGIDEALRLSYGLSSDLGGSMSRRGTEATIGLGLDAVSAGVAGSIASRMPSQFDNRFAQALETSQQRLMAAEQKLAAKQGRQPGQIQVPAGGRLAGQAGIEMQSELAGQFPKSNIADAARSTQETLTRLFDNFTSKIPATPNDFADIAAGKEAQKAALSQQIAGATGRSKAIIELTLDRQTRGPSSNIDELGDILLSSLKNAKQQAIDDVGQDYKEIFFLADQAGFKITPEEMIDVVARMKRDVNVSGAAETSAVDGVLGRLKAKRDAPKNLARAKERMEEMLSEGKTPPQDLVNKIQDLETLALPMDSRAFDDFIKNFREARPKDMASGAGKDVFGRKIANKLSEYRKNIYDSLETTLPDGTTVNVGNLFEATSKEVDLRRGYEKNLLGNILKEVAGEQATTPRDIVGAVLKEPATVSRVVKSLRELGASDPSKAGEANRILGLLQVQYMNDIGVQPIVRGSSRVREVKPDEGMLNALFGQNAPAIARSLQDMNVSMRQIGKIDSTKLTIEDIRRMSLPLPDEERKALTKTIAKRLQLEEEEKRLISSEIFKLAKKGNFDNIDPDILSKSILSPSSTIGDVTVAMRELGRASIESRNLYKGDFLRELLDQYKGGTPTANAPFTPLFNTKRFITDYESPSGGGKTALAKKLETVLGKSDADFIYDLAKSYEANIITDVSKSGFAPRTMGSDKGGLTVILPLGQVASSVRNRYIAAMLSTGSKRHSLKAALARNALPGGVNNAYNEMFKELFLTRTGVTALAHQASSDPEFSAELLNTAKEFSQKQGIPEENLPNPRR
jgi:hypothetical protein